MTQTQPAPVNESFVLRCAAGLTVRQAADLCGVRPSTWKAWENGAEPPAGALGPIKPLVRPPTSGGGAFRFVDLFAGIGGMRRAFEAAGGDCVMTAEWNREALRTYVANHGAGHMVVGDITKVAAADVPDHDVLVGGFPCFPAGTLVETDEGQQAIETIRVGNLVETHRGRLRRVLNVMRKEGAPLVEVALFRRPPFRTTDEHPFYARLNTGRGEGLEALGPPEWVPAGDLTPAHHVALPADPPAVRSSRDGSPGFWRLMGRWLRECRWSADGAPVVVTDGDDMEELCSIADEHGIRADVVAEGSRTVLHVRCEQFAQGAREMCRVPGRPSLPHSVFGMCRGLQGDLWRGWSEAGSSYRRGGTDSRALAVGMARVARNAFGVVPRISAVPGSERDDTAPGAYRLLVGDGFGMYPTCDDFAWVPVVSVTRTEGVATVHNIEVADDNSYVAEGVVVHNCQPFSLAGVSKKNSLGRAHGFADATQGTLFFDVARIIEEKRPAAFLLENVRNLLAHDKGRTFGVIRRTLEDELGYAISFKVMDGSAWVPQRRPRIFIVGFREGAPFDFSTVEVPGGGPTLGSILHSGSPDPEFAPDGFALPKYVLSDGLWRYLKDYAAKHQAAGNGFGYGLVGEGDVARTLSARYGKDGSEILVRMPSGNPRRLTPRECSRLMGYDLVGEPMAIPVSDSAAYKQFGNSVIVPCVAAIAEAMADRLFLETTTDEVVAARLAGRRSLANLLSPDQLVAARGLVDATAGQEVDGAPAYAGERAA